MLKQPILRSTLCAVLLAAAAARASVARAADLGGAEWIWSSKYTRYQVPKGPLFFRKVISLGEVESAKIELTADDRYELYVNGRRVGAGSDWKTLESHNLTKFLGPGRNVIAVRGDNDQVGAAGLVARITAKQKDGKLVTVLTDATWKVHDQLAAGWEKSRFDDELWMPARRYGEFAYVGPWGDRPRFPGEPEFAPNRFTTLPGFKVEEAVPPGTTGSLVAMAFDERGDIIASRENGPLLRIHDADGDGVFESVTTFCDRVKNCQGILPLGGQVYAVATGPDGTGMYRLSDRNGDHVVDRVETLLKLKFIMSEHGPHAVILGPDGMLYFMIGNHAGIDRQPDPASPFRHYYDAELLLPKYEDPTGHAAGIKAPGGTVVRLDRNAKRVELFAGGFRNAYDLAVNRSGDLFTYDSDMEYDVGLPWYRPTRVCHITAAADFGWKSGWTNWPEHYFDSLPATLNMGRGSPTGLEVYDHTRLPQKYRDALFMCDWSTGRVLAVTLKPAGGSYEAQSEVFLEGRPLNCSDIAVGPDGWIYICVGGRGTQGSIFRVVSTAPATPAAKDAPPAAASPGKTPPATDVQQAIAQPQFYSAWARRRIEGLRAHAGRRWGIDLRAAAHNAQSPAADRTRSLDLLDLFGPPASADDLLRLSHDDNTLVRTKATYLLGLHRDKAVGVRLAELLDDPVPRVQRVACESLVRGGHRPPRDKVIRLMANPQRFVAWAARRALEQLPKQEWQEAVLSAEQPRAFLVGSIALMDLDPDRPTIDAILLRAGKMLPEKAEGNPDLLDLVRVVHVALARGAVKPKDVESLRARLSPLYPAHDVRLNRELVRILVYLQDPTLARRLVDQLLAGIPLEEQIHVAMHAPFLKTGWDAKLRGEVLAFFEQARSLEGGVSYRSHLTIATNDFLKMLTPLEQLELIASGARTPVVTLGLIQNLPVKPSPEQLAALKKLDQSIAQEKSEAAHDLAKAAVNVLVRGDANSLAYLYGVFEANPERRPDVARALALAAISSRQYHKQDQALLVRSLASIDGSAGRDVLRALARYPQHESAGPILRQVILLGLKLGEQGGADAVTLLETWTGQRLPTKGVGDLGLAAWQDWFRKKYADLPDPSLPLEAAGTKWTYNGLLDFINSAAGMQGDAQAGAKVFEKALCIKCHRFGTRGEGVGPDLTDVRKRFQRKEILESVMFPSAVISDLFQAKVVTTQSGLTYVGIVGPLPGGGITVFQANAEKVTIKKDDIDTQEKSKLSAMPEGLFNKLELKEIADLFAYLTAGAPQNGKSVAGK